MVATESFRSMSISSMSISLNDGESYIQIYLKLKQRSVCKEILFFLNKRMFDFKDSLRGN